MQAPAEKKYEKIIQDVQNKLIGWEEFKGFIKPGRDYRVICNCHRKRTINAGCQIFSVQIFAWVIQLLVHKHKTRIHPQEIQSLQYTQHVDFTIHANTGSGFGASNCFFVIQSPLQSWKNTVQTYSLLLFMKYSLANFKIHICEIQLLFLQHSLTSPWLHWLQHSLVHKYLSPFPCAYSLNHLNLHFPPQKIIHPFWHHSVNQDKIYNFR